MVKLSWSGTVISLSPWNIGYLLTGFLVTIVICPLLVAWHRVEAMYVMEVDYFHFQKKKELSSQGYEAVSDDVVAQLYIDEKALQLFLWADTEDRAAKFSK